jgi:hypothetical protein
MRRADERNTTGPKLEFIMEYIAALPGTGEAGLRDLMILFVDARPPSPEIVGVEAFWRFLPACGSI